MERRNSDSTQKAANLRMVSKILLALAAFAYNMSKHSITFTYLNIRQSIFILCFKLISIDILLASLIGLSFWGIVTGGNFFNVNVSNPTIFLYVFAGIALFKMYLSTYVILAWLNEYYEITPEYIYHKQGIIFRKVEQYNINNIRAMDIQDTFLSQLFNFATITLYDIRMNKYLDLYLVHNPERYAEVLQELRPHIEQKRDHIRLPLLPKEGKQEAVEI